MKNASVTFPLIVTERLILRALDSNDADLLLKLRSDEQVNLYLDRPPTKTIADAQGFIERINGFIKEGKSLYWAISLKNRSDLIGTICLWNFDPQKNMAEIGYELMPEYQGKGLMNEAMQGVIQYCFEELQLNVIAAITHPDNKASAKLLERNGFEKDVKSEFVSEEDAENLTVYMLEKD